MHTHQRASPPLRLLLSEGSSLSAREVITTLGLKGYEMEICDPDPWCLGRFSRFVRRFHRCPGLGADPEGYLAFMLDLVSRRRFDVLLPIHEQGLLFAKVQDQFAPYVDLALPSFESYKKAHSKVGFSQLLLELALPQPQTECVTSAQELLHVSRFPFVVKTAIGTASRGVWKILTATDLQRVVLELEEEQAFDAPVLVQEFVNGTLERAQAVFCKGWLVALHGYRQVVPGAGGGDAVKESVHRSLVRSQVAQIGKRLNWHGALSVDYILREEEGTPVYIDCNPRLVEPVNALHSGLDLADLLVRVSLGEAPPTLPDEHKRACTHMALQVLLACALQRGSRRELLRECCRLLLRQEPYRSSHEELTPVHWDWLSGIPLVAVVLWLLANPQAAHHLSRTTARSSQLNLQSVRAICDQIGQMPHC